MNNTTTDFSLNKQFTFISHHSQIAYLPNLQLNHLLTMNIPICFAIIGVDIHNITLTKKDTEATFSTNISNLSIKLSFGEEMRVMEVSDKVDVVEVMLVGLLAVALLSLLTSSSTDRIKGVDGMDVVSSSL